MHNWWLATLEQFEVITKAQAEHISKEIKTSIHKDIYKEAAEDLKMILSKNKDLSETPFSRLEDKLLNLKTELSDIKADIKSLKKPVAKNPKP